MDKLHCAFSLQGAGIWESVQRTFQRADVYKFIPSVFLVCKIIFEVCEINLKINWRIGIG